jgi:hypothetical protein
MESQIQPNQTIDPSKTCKEYQTNACITAMAVSMTQTAG